MSWGEEGRVTVGRKDGRKVVFFFLSFLQRKISFDNWEWSDKFIYGKDPHFWKKFPVKSPSKTIPDEVCNS